MILKTKQIQEYLVFELEGQIDFESTQQLQTTCKKKLENSAATKVIFNLGRLKFVGSTGINHFIRTLHEINHKSLHEKARLCHLSNEFKKVFESVNIPKKKKLLILESEEDAISSFTVATKPRRKIPSA